MEMMQENDRSKRWNDQERETVQEKLEEEERVHLRDVWIENKNQYGFQSKPIPVRWPLRWEVTDKKDTWSDEFLGNKSVLRNDGKSCCN